MGYRQSKLETTRSSLWEKLSNVINVIFSVLFQMLQSGAYYEYKLKTKKKLLILE